MMNKTQLDERISEMSSWCDKPSTRWPDPHHCHECGVGGEQIKALIREVVAECVPERKDPRLIDAGNEAYQRTYQTAADNFKHGFNLAQEFAISEMEAKMKELGL